MNFSGIKICFTAYVLCSLGLVKIKTKEKTKTNKKKPENFSENVQR